MFHQLLHRSLVVLDRFDHAYSHRFSFFVHYLFESEFLRNCVQEEGFESLELGLVFSGFLQLLLFDLLVLCLKTML